MEKTWFPQRNKLDCSVALLKNFVFNVNHPISRLTVEADTKAHAEFPMLSFGHLSEILAKWGLQSIVYKLDIDKLTEIPYPSISFIHDERDGIKMGLFIMLDSVKGDKIEYLHTDKGWVIESLEDFKSKWENTLLSLTANTLPAGEPDFIEKENKYVEAANANPGRKILRARDNFLSDWECEYIINLSNDRFKRSKVMSNDEKHQKGRTSYSAELVLPNDEILNSIKERAAAIIGLPETHFEFFQCVSYGPGQEFQSHYDTFDEKTPEGSKAVQEEGQRKYTMLAYLNDDFEGGCTYFPDLDLLINPKKGRVIIFENIDETGVIRKAAYHAGMPVKTGKKYAINMWVRTKPTIPSKYIKNP